MDLHCARYTSSRELAELLDHHAVREERLLYRWADERLAASAIERVTQHIVAAG